MLKGIFIDKISETGQQKPLAMFSIDFFTFNSKDPKIFISIYTGKTDQSSGKN